MATDTSGNQAVAFEWGNLPMQPNDARNGIVLGAKGIHEINGVTWDGFPTVADAGGHELVDGDPLYIVPSYTFCWSSPYAKDAMVWDYLEYLRAAGVNPELLVEATFDGVNKYDWGTTGNTNNLLGGIVFWAYIPKDVIVNIDWATGTVVKGSDFDGMITAMYSSPGSTVDVASDWYNHSVVAFTNDPNKNNTAGWWY
jgi:hypothetical protein